jgi:hypothetical protein
MDTSGQLLNRAPVSLIFLINANNIFSWIQVTSATLFEKEGLTANKFTLLLIVSTQNKRGDRNGLSAVNP